MSNQSQSSAKPEAQHKINPPLGNEERTKVGKMIEKRKCCSKQKRMVVEPK